MQSHRERQNVLRLASVLALFGLVVGAGSVSAHAELIGSVPADGAILSVAPREVVATFSEAVDGERSRLEVRDASGATVAQGGVPDPSRSRLRVALPVLEPGRYTVRWTAVTPDDGAVTRGTFAFAIGTTVTPAPSAPSRSLAPTRSPVPTVRQVTPAPTAVAPPSPTSTPAGPERRDDGPSGAETWLPIAAAVAVAALLGLRLWRARGTDA